MVLTTTLCSNMFSHLPDSTLRCVQFVQSKLLSFLLYSVAKGQHVFLLEVPAISALTTFKLGQGMSEMPRSRASHLTALVSPE